MTNRSTPSEAAILETHISRCRCHGTWSWDGRCPISGETDQAAVIAAFALEMELRKEHHGEQD